MNANLVNGKLKAHDLAGRAELSTVNGSSEVSYSTLANVNEVKISAVNGSINLVLPASPNAGDIGFFDERQHQERFPDPGAKVASKFSTG